MNIERRLLISNLIMLVVPVIMTLLIGAGCIFGVFQVVRHGSDWGVDNAGGFYLGSRVTTELAERWLKHDADMDDKGFRVLQQMLDAGNLRLVVYQNGQLVVDYGAASSQDEGLLAASKGLQGSGVMAMVENRIMFSAVRHIKGREYAIFVLGNQDGAMSQDMRLIIMLAAILLVAGIIFSILLTNRLLTRFMVRKITEPLKLLSKGAQELGAGSLSYRIAYERQDEFSPVCQAFNEMAGQLERLIRRAKEDEASRRELLMGISHDLRSPLTSIKAYVEGLLDGIADTPETQQRYLLTIKRKAEDIDRMVNQLFAYSKLDMEKYSLELQQIDLAATIGQMLQGWQLDYSQQGLELQLAVSSRAGETKTANTQHATQLVVESQARDAQVMMELSQSGNMLSCADFRLPEGQALVMADVQLLERTIRNILDNSVKYKDKPAGHMQVTLSVEDYLALPGGTGAAYQLVLEDDGPGVATEVMDKLFDAFYRTDPARRNPAGGSGLGLAIAAKAIGAMGGRIFARTSSLGGLAIVIQLPQRKKQA